ncbi:MAG: twin-arginine translocase TatA/TatE family subunit [Kiritimatiellia bacterium]|nr:twin-arginine translocase TatA/TatE family subunit [Lentisphaerota bacterium]
MRPGLLEIIAIAAVIVLLFGARRLPELARALGRSLNEFKKGRHEGLPAENESDQPKDKPTA